MSSEGQLDDYRRRLYALADIQRMAVGLLVAVIALMLWRSV